MPFFSRLTDIVTCNLTSMLATATDPQATLAEIIREMEQGIAGAQRCMRTAIENENRVRAEIDEQRRQSEYWVSQARHHLEVNNEELARLDLLRKHEVENLLAGLEIQSKSAAATRAHLTTTFHALEARLADARRRLASYSEPAPVAAAEGGRPGAVDVSSRGTTPLRRATDVIDVELAALKRELGQESL